MPASTIPPRGESSQTRRNADAPSETDIGLRRLLDTLVRMRGLSTAMRIVEAARECGLEIPTADFDDAALAVAETLQELCAGADADGGALILTTLPRCAGDELRREAHRRGVLRSMASESL